MAERAGSILCPLSSESLYGMCGHGFWVNSLQHSTLSQCRPHLLGRACHHLASCGRHAGGSFRPLPFGMPGVGVMASLCSMAACMLQPLNIAFGSR